MSGGKKRKQRFDPDFETNQKLAAIHQEIAELTKKHTAALLSEIQGLISPASRSVDSQEDTFLAPASRSVDSQEDTFLHGSEGEAEGQQQPKYQKLVGNFLQGWIEGLIRTGELGAEPKNQLDSQSSPPAPSPQQGLVEADSNISSSSSTQPPTLPEFPPYPENNTPKQIRNWRSECQKVANARKKAITLLSSDSESNLTTLGVLNDQGTTNALQDWRSKQVVLAAARSIVSITPISDDGPTGPQCTGFILRRCEHSGVVFSILVTGSMVVCKKGRKLDPLPKLSIRMPDKKTVLEAKLLYFNYHFDIAFLLLPSELSLDLPSVGCCPEYNQEVFVLGRDEEGFLRVRHGEISWTEESNFIGRGHYMFLDGEVPQGGTGGPVIDTDGVFRGMAFRLSPKPAVLSISTILKCLEMFMHFGQIARPIPGWSLRTVASANVHILESLSKHGIEKGYIVEEVHDETPAQVYGIREGEVIQEVNGLEMMTLPELEDHLLSLGKEHLTKSVPTTNLKLKVCDVKGQTRWITMPVMFSTTCEYEG